jgi:predicted O-linked N-acetylglucosamine transferase (SPINDLY family)
MEAIDYRLTDSWLDPSPQDDANYAERSIRLPDCWVCYDPLTDIAPASLERDAAPCCFASLNNPCKINEPMLRVWADVLKAVPDSRLMLLVHSQMHRQRIAAIIRACGVDPARVEFVARRGRNDYLRQYDRIDICLDTLPYNGITTTCDALWMGVPVVSHIGRTSAGRAGHGMLSMVGLEDLVARTPQEFVQIASALAADSARLRELRSTLRARMQGSPLMDAPRFARNVEAAYRQMWRIYCQLGRHTTAPAPERNM